MLGFAPLGPALSPPGSRRWVAWTVSGSKAQCFLADNQLSLFTYGSPMDFFRSLTLRLGRYFSYLENDRRSHTSLILWWSPS